MRPLSSGESIHLETTRYRFKMRKRPRIGDGEWDKALREWAKALGRKKENLNAWFDRFRTDTRASLQLAPRTN